MNTPHHGHYGPATYPYNAQQAVADGLAVEPFPEITAEAGYRLAVIFTKQAYAEAVDWTRADLNQDIPGRYSAVLDAARPAVRRALTHPGTAFPFVVARIPNWAANGAESRAELPTHAVLYIRLEALDWELTPCLVIGLPGED